MGLDAETQEDTEFVKFWNTVLEPKFTRYRHILQGGLSRHSAAVLPKLPLERAWPCSTWAVAGATCPSR